MIFSLRKCIPIFHNGFLDPGQDTQTFQIGSESIKIIVSDCLNSLETVKIVNVVNNVSTIKRSFAKFETTDFLSIFSNFHTRIAPSQAQMLTSKFGIFYHTFCLFVAIMTPNICLFCFCQCLCECDT